MPVGHHSSKKGGQNLLTIRFNAWFCITCPCGYKFFPASPPQGSEGVLGWSVPDQREEVLASLFPSHPFSILLRNNMFLYHVMVVVSTAAALKVYKRNAVKRQNVFVMKKAKTSGRKSQLIKYINLSL